jgi:hypothetical protein
MAILFAVTLPYEFLYLVLPVLSKTQLMFTTSLGAVMRCCCVPNQDFTLQAIYIVRTHQIMDVQNVGIIAVLAAIKILLLATVQNYEYYKSTNLQLRCSLYEL